MESNGWLNAWGVLNESVSSPVVHLAESVQQL
jgi:hypothetical protein